MAGTWCAESVVPLQPATAADKAATVTLFVRKFPALGVRRSRGQVWLIAGGPGESGASLYPALPAFRAAFAGYDLMIPDHRGTGFSSKLCPAEESPDSADGIALAGAEWGGCIGAMHGDVARSQGFTISNAAHDLATLITRHRTRGRVYVYGVSYGTQLVVRMMQLAPPRLDGIILDGLVPPETAPQWDLSRRTEIVDAVGRSLLSPEQIQRYLSLLVQSEPAWLANVPGGDLRRLLGSLLNIPSARDRIPQIIDGLSRVDDAPLQAALADAASLSNALSLYPQSPPSLPLVMLISGSENNDRREISQDMVSAEARDALFTSTLPGLLVNSPAPLYQRDAAFGRLPQRLPRTLVVHGTLDPNTPYEGALEHARLLAPAGAVQVATVERGAHFLALLAPECFVGAVSAFVRRAAAPDRCTEPGPRG
ncbi:MAG: alpha/beta hydrolase, partial [Blastomonas sp.]|nr:alpha/beta hydrolase [Blastomonas sp.]